jgi:hypothetical protein
MTIRIAITVITMFWIIASDAQVLDTRLPVADRLIGAAVNPHLDYSPEGRLTLVRLLADYCDAVLNTLPTNTPTEEAWVNAEGQTTDLQKVRRLTGSKEYARSRLKMIFLSCRDATRHLIQTQARAGSGRRNYEMADLVGLAIDFNDSNGIETYARNAGLNSQTFGFDFLGAVRRSLLIAALKGLGDD